ncbi:MAG: hypothetical protein CMO01_12695 [Thalassobius sp.]|nr:hypothetical protein [Thalassovita sp.]
MKIIKVFNILFVTVIILSNIISCKEQKEKHIEYNSTKLLGDYYSGQSIDEFKIADPKFKFKDFKEISEFEDMEGFKYKIIENELYIHNDYFGKVSFYFKENHLYSIHFMPKLPRCYLEYLKDSLSIDLINNTFYQDGNLRVHTYHDMFYIYNVWVIWDDIQFLQKDLQSAKSSLDTILIQKCF